MGPAPEKDRSFDTWALACGTNQAGHSPPWRRRARCASASKAQRLLHRQGVAERLMAISIPSQWSSSHASAERSGIRVNEHLQTSAPHIWAVGDAVEVRDAVTGAWSLIPLAGPANRQGRIAADHIFGRPCRYQGTWGTAILRLFDLTAACTGANEKTLRDAGVPFEAIHLHPSSQAGYYPGASAIALKLLFAPDTGKLLGAQAVGRDGVDKRIDVLATALQAGMTVHDLAELELAYAPPFSAAKDPVNLAGMVAQNILAGDVNVMQWYDVANLDPHNSVLLDVRDEAERQQGLHSRFHPHPAATVAVAPQRIAAGS
jgi:hypothetical protein